MAVEYCARDLLKTLTTAQVFELSGQPLDYWLELRKHDLTASDVPAVFGVHAYRSALRVWHEKAGSPAGR